MGKPGFPIPLRGGAWGNPVSPRPWGLCSHQVPWKSRLLRSIPQVSPFYRQVSLGRHSRQCEVTIQPSPCGCAIHRRDEKRFFLGGLRPPKPSPQVWIRGNPLSPSPCARAAPSPSRGRGRGETRFPHIPAPAAYVHVRTSNLKWYNAPARARYGCAAWSVAHPFSGAVPFAIVPVPPAVGGTGGSGKAAPPRASPGGRRRCGLCLRILQEHVWNLA